MEAIKLKLSQAEAGKLIKYLTPIEPTMDVGTLALIEWQEKLWKRAIHHKVNGKNFASYHMPASVAVALWKRMQQTELDDVLQLTLSQIDYALTNRGLKRPQPTPIGHG